MRLSRAGYHHLASACRRWALHSCWSFLLLAMLLVACNGQAAAPTRQGDPAAILEPSLTGPHQGTATPLPASTTPPPSATVTQTPAPTLTYTPTPTPTPATTTLLFTGVIVPARCVQAAIDRNGNPNYPYEEVKETISEAVLAVGALNASTSDFPPRTGCVPTYVLVGSANNADALQWAGFDLMSVATNHIKDCGVTRCGDRAFLDTMDNLHRAGILPVGAGLNHAEAMQPVVVTLNGVRFGFISLGHINNKVFAGEDSPGIAILNKANIHAAVEAARQVADVVIAMPHWGPEDSSTPTWIQRGLADEWAAAGVDLVVGNHTHVVQEVHEVDGVPVFYGLGNFVFDQDLQDHQQGVMLLVHFQGAEMTGYDLIPTHVDEDGRVHIAGPEEAAETLNRMGVK